MVRLDAETSRRQAKFSTPEQIRAIVDGYVNSKGSTNVFALDLDELKDSLRHNPKLISTTTQLQYAESLFNEHVKRKLEEIDTSAVLTK